MVAKTSDPDPIIVLDRDFADGIWLWLEETGQYIFDNPDLLDGKNVEFLDMNKKDEVQK